MTEFGIPPPYTVERFSKFTGYKVLQEKVDQGRLRIYTPHKIQVNSKGRAV